MSWLDNMIGFISPRSALIREISKQNLEELKRNYDAGSHDKSNANWGVTNQSAEFTDKYNRDNVRARARDLERNSDMMNSVVGAYKRNVVGGGYALRVNTPDEELNTLIQKQWKKWCKKKNCDVTGTQSFNQIIRMAVARKKVDGGILFIKRYTQGGNVPFKIQMIEVDELDVCSMSPKTKGNKVVGGIEYNPYNKAIGYFIRQYSIDGYTTVDPIYIDAKDVIFYYTKTRPSQIREMSDMSPTITRIRDANEFMVAVSVKERINACLSVFIKRAAAIPGLMGRDSKTNNNDSGQSYDGKTISPGMIKELNAGDEIQVVNPSGQATDATGYIKLQQRLVGGGQGLSYEATSRDMSETNYASARQGMIEDGLTYAEEIELLVEVMDEVYETFIISGVLNGLFPIKDFWNRKDEFFEHEWIQAPKKWIDPLKEANATRIAMQTGQKTFKQVAAENGRDWKEQIKEINDVLAYAKEFDLEIGGVIFDKTKEELYQNTGSDPSNQETKTKKSTAK